ncbi:MAG: hypothetical protein R3C56_28680 [Pirellulaceae bacterium]
MVDQVATAVEQTAARKLPLRNWLLKCRLSPNPLALLQMRREAHQTRDQAAQNLEKRTAEEAELKAQLEAAEQAASTHKTNCVSSRIPTALTP